MRSTTTRIRGWPIPPAADNGGSPLKMPRWQGYRSELSWPAGQLQVATALEVLDALETRLDIVRRQLLDTPGT